MTLDWEDKIAKEKWSVWGDVLLFLVPKRWCFFFKFHDVTTSFLCQYVCSKIFHIFVGSICLRFDSIPSKKRSESISDSSELHTGILYLDLWWWSELLVHYFLLFPYERAKTRKVKVKNQVLSLNFARQLLAGWPLTFQQSKALSIQNDTKMIMTSIQVELSNSIMVHSLLQLQFEVLL